MDKKLRKKLIIFIMLAFVAIAIVISEASANIKKINKDNELRMEQEKEEQRIKDKKLEEDKKLKEERDSFEVPKCNEAEWLLFTDDKDKYQKVINITSQVIERYPDSKKAYTLRGRAYGYLYSASEKNKDKAMKDLDKAIEIDSSYGYGLFNKALILELWGEYDESLKWYDKAIESDDKYQWNYYGKASIYGRRGDIKNTIENLKKAIDIDPSIKNTAKSEHDFDNVKKYKEFQDLLNN